jgi:two-component system, LytTR family, response regulator
MDMTANKPKMLCFTDLSGLTMINSKDIIFCKSQGSYTELILEESAKLISKRLKKIELMLPESDFIRIHHFYVINFHHVNSILKRAGKMTVVLSNGVELPVSRRKAPHFNAAFIKV